MYSLRQKKLSLPLEKYEDCLKADKFILQDLLRQELLIRAQKQQDRLFKTSQIET